MTNLFYVTTLLFSGIKKISAIFALTILFFGVQTSAFAQVKLPAKNEHTNSKDSLTGITIHQEIIFNASPQRLYEVLLSSKEFSACTKKSFPDFTISSAHIDSSLGGAFSVFDGHIIGRILELVPGHRIVEAWRVVDWPAGVYSIARFEFKAKGTGTELIFDHTGFPKGLKQHLATGWQEHYWDALIKYFQ